MVGLADKPRQDLATVVLEEGAQLKIHSSPTTILQRVSRDRTCAHTTLRSS